MTRAQINSLKMGAAICGLFIGTVTALFAVALAGQYVTKIIAG